MLADLVFIAGASTAVALLAAWAIFFLNDLTYAERVRFLPRWLWAVLCLATIPFGGIAYLLIGRVRPRHRGVNPPA